MMKTTTAKNGSANVCGLASRFIKIIASDKRDASAMLCAILVSSAFSHSVRRARRLRHLLRATIELGTDLVKIGYDEALTKILADIREDVAVLVAGGQLSSQAEIFAQVSHALTAGAAGVCIGRNVFASEDPNGFLQSLAQIVHGRMEAKESSAALL